MENDIVATEDSLAVICAKAFAVNLAASAGVMVGMLMVGFVVGHRNRDKSQSKTTEEK